MESVDRLIDLRHYVDILIEEKRNEPVKEKIEVKFVDNTQDFINYKDINRLFNYKENSQIGVRLIKAFQNEVNRVDSKFNKLALIENEDRRTVHKIAFLYFIKHKKLLENENTRKDVKQFNINDFKDLYLNLRG